jgi:hypothetical protein
MAKNVKQDLVAYMNREYARDFPEDVQVDEDYIAYGVKMNDAIHCSQELLAPNGEQLYWNVETRQWEIGPISKD